uniref:Uncharacterized protein n=1 Tax=Rhizophora mucronata TaxID=61149 RepID=A0A2P2N3R8_RHIMU
MRKHYLINLFWKSNYRHKNSILTRSLEW